MTNFQLSEGAVYRQHCAMQSVAQWMPSFRYTVYV